GATSRSGGRCMICGPEARTTKEAAYFGRFNDPGKDKVKTQLRHARRSLDLGLQNVRLWRIKEALFEEIRRHLIRHSLRSLDEHIVGDPSCLRSEDCHAHSREDVKVVGLTLQKCPPIQWDRRGRRTPRR